MPTSKCRNTTRYYICLLFFLCCSFFYCGAQNIARVEYFVDTDPGFGNAFEAPIGVNADNANISVDFQFDISTLSNGFHNLYIRSLVNPYQVLEEGQTVTKGGWSLTQARTFYKETVAGVNNQLTDIIAGEYFIDSDPGFGSGTPIPVASNAGSNITDLNFTFDITNLTTGFHNLYIRFKDANGAWSHVNVRTLYKENITGANTPLPNIVSGEYFIDTDPGFGNGSPVQPVTAGVAITDANFTIDVTALTAGFHNLYIRFKDANGTWSHANARTFYKENITAGNEQLPNITEGEYFVDTDPGFGNATKIAPAFTGAANISDLNFTVDITSLAEGFHNLYARFRNTNGTWSHASIRSFYKEIFSGPQSLPDITQLEYFVDTDPGFGKGSLVAVNAAAIISTLTFPIDMTNVSIGNHRVYVRALNATGKWSLVSTGSFTVEPPAAIYITVGNLDANACAGNPFKIPFTVNTPYGSNNIFTAQLSDANGGFANPVNLGSFTGNNNDTIRATIPANSAAGNAYRVRVLSSSPTDTSAASSTSFIIRRVPEQFFSINGKSQPCIGAQSYTASVVENGASYTWVLSGGGTIVANGTSATVSWTTAGNYTLSLTASNSCGAGTTRNLSVTVYGAPPTIAANGPLTFCQGSSVVLTSSSPTGNVWSTGATSQSITVTTSGTYSVALGAGGCSTGNPESVVVTVNPSLTPSFAGIAPICAGSAVPVLPAISNNGIAGTWSPSIISKTSSGTYTFTATPVLGQCFLPATLLVTITPVITPTFAAIAAIAAGAVAPLLPATSLNGIVGTWSPATISNSQTGTYTFTPNGGGPCIATVTITVNVLTAPDLAVQSITANKTELSPNELVTVSWNVANIGSASSFENWTERIYIQSATGENRTLVKQAVFTSDGVLNIGQSLSRTTDVNMPSQLNIGDQGVFVVEIIPGNNITEAPGTVANNTGIQPTPWTISRKLSLILSSLEITEGSAAGISVSINRTGSLNAALTVNISLQNPGRFSFPATLTIPAGQSGRSFNLIVPDNNLIEGNLTDKLDVTATGFQPTSANLLIIDNDKPTLTITNLAAEALEGNTVNFQVNTNLAPAAPLVVYLSSNNQARFPVPASVTIAAGALSSTVTVTLAQDNIPEIDQSVGIIAGANNHLSASGSILVKDDDVPGLELVIKTNIVSESAGFFATEATLRRKAGSNSIAFTANLSSSLANTLILPAGISLAAGENEKTFNIGVIDNVLADGQRDVAITAAIFVNSCGCSAPPSSAGSVTATLTVSDNDGPSLQLTANPLTLSEGLSNAGTLRITRNTPTTQTQVVNLSSSNTNEVTLPATASIPAGASFVEVPITTINDGVTDGSKQVNLQVTASGFSPGAVWVLVTDLNKPDLLITSATVNNPNIQALTVFDYRVSVKNTGFATAPTGVLVRGYLSLDNSIDASDSLISEDIIPGSIGIGQTVQVLNAVAAPNLPGQYKLLYWVNPVASLTELLYTNNTSQPTDITIKPDYTATANVNLPYFLRGLSVPVTGAAVKSNGTAAANLPVEVYVVTNGLRRKILATTDASGNYSTQFVPLSNEVGHYTVGASFPGINATTEQDAFDILGVRINGGTIPQFKVILNDTLKGTLSVQNLSNKSLANFTIAPVDLPGGATIRFETVALLAGNSTINLAYKALGKSLSPGSNFIAARMNATADEGTIQSADVFYFCQAPNAYVVADITKIDISTSQSQGERLVEFRLVNKGVGETGKLTISLPQVSWLSSITPKEVTNLSSGDTLLVVLKFRALAEVPFNFPISGSIGINTLNGNSFTIPYSFEKVSQTNGAVKVTVTDQFTFFTDAAPKVKGAHVTIKNYFSGVVYAEGLTDDNGVFLMSGIPEGTHRISVDKDKHQPYNSTITINPGDTIQSTVFINYQAITFDWTVVPTAIQDVYDITLTTKFETNVPMPVVTIDMPKTMPKLTGTEVYAFNVTLTNHGLITARDVALNMPDSDPEYEFVTNYVAADLLAQQSIQVPVMMRLRTTQGRIAGRSGSPSYSDISKFLGISPPNANKVGSSPAPCDGYVIAVYWYTCNLSSGLWEKSAGSFKFPRNCDGGGTGGGEGTNYPIFTGSGGGGNGFPPCAFCPVIPGGTGTGATPAVTQEKKSCVQCLNDLAQAILGCLGVNIPPEIGCGASAVIDKGGPKSYALCVAKGYAESIASKIPYISQLLCIKALLEALETCLASAQNRPLNNRNALKPSGNSGNAVFQEFADNLHIVANAYSNRIGWNTEYFGDLSLNDSWKEFYQLIAIHVDSLTVIPATKQADIISKMAGYDMPSSAIQQFFTRWNKSIQARDLDILTPNSQYPDIINWTLIKAYSDSLVDAHNFSINKGFKTIDDMRSKTDSSMNVILDQQKNAVCASVTVQFSQQLTMTREAFEGTLEIFNGHPSEGMDSLSVNLQITDANGVPSNGLFEIQTKTLTNLANVTGTGKIASQQKGSVKFLFIPELLAAPTAPKVYNFGGSVRYWDPYAKAMVTLPLSSVALTVNPSPNLYLHYFMQRNILGDDALTSPAIEPSVPAELAVMVENQGYGPAVNMTISSAQPKIVENEKGLAINFNLIGSNFQGKPTNFGVNNINFGTIPGLQTRIGQWYFTSSLLGKFVSYEAKVVHANSFGNPDLSLVKGIKLHELTRSIRGYGALEDGINDFLVNDIFDVTDQPDIIYFSQGNRTEKVIPATDGNFSSPVSAPAFTNTLLVNASDTGWNYIKLNDPGNNKYELFSVTRSDGQLIPLINAWLTFVTLPVSRPPVYENKFHFVDKFASKVPVTYTVVWKPVNSNVPKITRIEGVPALVVSTPVENLTVVFDKAIDPATFTYEDLTLTFQGGANIMNSSVVITQLDTATFKVDIAALTNGNGFYAFTAQAANVQDIYGIKGTTGKQVTWTQFLTVPTVQAYLQLPAGKTAPSFDTVGVLFNLAIDKTTVTPQSFAIVKDGIAQPGLLVIDSVKADNKLFYLSGLKNILTQSGIYQLVVDLPNIKSVGQIAGLKKDSLTLTVDNTGPMIVTMAKSDSGSLDPQHITYVNIKFNEDIVGFNTSSVKLTRNGEVLPLNIAQLLNIDFKNWKAGNFGLLTYPDGVYTFTVDLTGFTDAIGNKGTGTQTITWTVNRSLLISITNLSVGPDLGFSNTDAVTSGQSLNVAFNLGANASQVTISQFDLSGETVLVTVPNVAAGNVSIPVTLITAGNTGIKVTATGAAGGIGIAQRLLFIDQTPLSAQWVFAANQHIAAQPDNIQLSFSSKLLSNTGFLNALQFSRNGTPVATGGLGFNLVNDSLYNIYGLQQASNQPGNYQLKFNLQPFSKYRSGIGGSGFVTVAWTVQSVNLPPIAKAGNDLLITAAGTYSLNGASSSDPESNPLSYRWVAPAGIVLSDSTLATPSFTITAANQGNTYSFLLIVSDGTLFTTDVVNVVVNIAATPVSFTGLSANYCANAIAVVLTGSPAGGVFSGPGVTGNTFNPAIAGAGNHSITYTKDGQAVTQNTVVNALPATPAIVQGNILSFCSGSSLIIGTEAATSYLWSPGGETTQTITVTSAGTYSVVVKNAAGCSSASSPSAVVTINPLPVVSLGDFVPVCSISPAFALTGGNPAVGIYSGTGVSNGQFDPAVAGVGTFSITYTFTNASGCSGSAVKTLTVSAMPGMGADIVRTKCPGFTYALTGVYANAGITYTYFTESFTPVVNAGAVATGVYQVIGTNIAGCADTAMVTVTDNAKPSLGADTSLYHTCANEFTNLDSLYVTSGLTALWNTINSAAAPPGTYRLIVSNTFGCQDTAFATIILETAIWKGTVSNDWHNPANWSTNKVPTLRTHVIIAAGTPNSCGVINGDAEAASIQLKQAAVFEVGSNRKLLLAQKCDALPSN